MTRLPTVVLGLAAELVGTVPDAVALIIEAPLSGCFNVDGNPTDREYDSTWDGKSLESGRGWYYGAGGSVALGAVFFVRRLRELVITRPATIVLFEGFVSFKRTKTTHVDDARRLLDLFVSERPGYRVVEPAGGARVTVLELLGERSEGPPRPHARALRAGAARITPAAPTRSCAAPPGLFLTTGSECDRRLRYSLLKPTFLCVPSQ